MALQHLRSSTADKRPTPAAMSDGQLALNTNLASPGLFFKDSNGDSVKIGPVHVGTTAPNVTPGAGGQAGNSKGEAWLDTTATNPILKVWNGSAFVAVQPVGTGTVVSTTDTGTVTSTMILDGTIVNADINASAAIVDTKLATIATAGKVSNSATTATNANTASAIVARDASGNFSAGTITAALTGAASSNVLKAGDTMTGALVVPLASAATPSLTFTGDLNTGIFSPGADQVAVATNGTGRLFVDANGNVGVGLSNPSYPLEVASSTNSTINITGGTSNSCRLFFSDTTLAIGFINYDHADDSINIGTAGSERLRITSAGLVGIGTSSPVSKINSVISQADNANVSDTTLANSFLHLGGGEYGLNRYFLTTYGYSTGRTNSGAFIGAIGASASGFGKYDLVFGTRDVTTDTAPDTRMIIKTDGKVGIGTTSPTRSLEVAVGLTSNNGILVTGSNSPGILISETSGNVNLNLVNDSSGAYLGTLSNHPVVLRTNNTERARLDTSGRLLVGTSTARGVGGLTNQVQVEGVNAGTYSQSWVRNVAGAGGATIFLGKSRSGSVGGVTIVNNNDQLGGIYWCGADGVDLNTAGASIEAYVDGTPGANDMPGRIVLSTTADGASSPTERMRIRANGALLFGKTSEDWSAPGIQMESSATQLTLTRDSNPPLVVRRNASDGTAVGFYRDSSAVGSISVTTTATAYNTSSDYRLKENVTPVTDGITRLQQLKPSRFNFIADPDNTVDGFLAHEVQTIVPEAITGEKDAVDDEGNPEYQGIDQSKLVPLLTAALQEAIGEIESLKARLTAAGI